MPISIVYIEVGVFLILRTLMTHPLPFHFGYV